MNVTQLLLNKFKKQKNRLLRGTVFSIILFLMLSLFSTPFNIYADDYSGDTIQGFNVNLVNTDTTYVGGTSGSFVRYLYEVEFILDDSYVGYISVGGTVNYYPTGSTTLSSYTINSRNRFVNGTSFVLTFELTGDGSMADDRPSLNNVTFTYGNHNLVKHSEITTIEQIYDILLDMYDCVDGVEGLLTDQNTVINNVLTKCTSIDNKLTTTNGYLNNIQNLRQYNIPLESLPIVWFNLTRYSAVSSYSYYYNYPYFQGQINRDICQLYHSSNDDKFVIVLFLRTRVNIMSASALFQVTDGNLANFEIINKVRNDNYNEVLCKFELHGDYSNSYTNVRFISSGLNTTYYSPIYCGKINAPTSLEFALRYNLKNEFVDSLKMLANGTTSSNQSSSSLETQNSTFSQTANDLYTQENSFNTQLNNRLNNIDTSFNLQNIGSSFLYAYGWVSERFNELTVNTPFGTVLSFSLLLGLAMLLIGKVFK